MAGFQVRRHSEAFSIPKRRPEKRKDYLAFVRQLPCAVTGQHGVEAAHLSTANPSFGHYGRAKGTKASDRWALPLSPEQHRKQHSMRETDYWIDAGVNPWELALVLFGLWSDYDEHTAIERCTARIMQGIRRNGERRQEYAQG